MSAPITYTTWTRTTNTAGVEETADWSALTAMLRDPPERSGKSECPMIKLATFKHGCKAVDLEALHGVEGDYDGGAVTLDAAAARLTAAGVRAFLYTSASHTAEKPRWRVFAPLSNAHSPNEHSSLLALLNGALGGILATESWTPAQRYYYGQVRGAIYESQTIEGEFLDKLDLTIAPIGKPRSSAPAGVDRSPIGTVNDGFARQVALHEADDQTIADLRSALSAIPLTDEYEDWLKPVLSLASLKETAFEGEAYELADEWSQRFGAGYDPDELASKWAGAKPDRITYKSIFKLAADAGWTNPRSATASAETAGAMPDRLARLEQSLIPLLGGADVFDELPHCVDKWIPQGEVTLMAGHGGGGKSYVALSIAVHVALGLPFGPLSTRQTNVLFFSGEDGAQVLRQRLARICRVLSLDPAQLTGRLHLLDASDMDAALHREQRATLNGRPTIITETPLLAELAALVQKYGIELVIIDNASDAYDDDEIKRARVRAFVRSLRSCVARPGRAVLLLAHVNKASATNGRNAGTEDYSGSTAWHNSVRSRLSLTPAGADALTIDHLKANLGGKAAPLRLEWRDGVPVVVDDAVAAATRAATQAENDQADKLALLEVIRSFEARGEHVTTARVGPQPTYSQLYTAKGFPKRITSMRQLTPLLRELEEERRICRRQYKTADRKNKECFTCASSNDSETAPMGIGPANLAATG